MNISTKGIPKKGLPAGFLYVDEVMDDCIVDAKYALLDLSVNPETLTYFYESKDLNTRVYTYMDTGSLYGGVDGAHIASAYSNAKNFPERPTPH